MARHSAAFSSSKPTARVEFPTTNLANTRTCEHLRRWGIADRMRFESGYPTDYPRNYVFVTRMDGYEIARFDHPANGAPDSRSPHSPEGRLWISKPYFDPVLHLHANSLPQVEIRYQTSFESFEQNADASLSRSPRPEKRTQGNHQRGLSGWLRRRAQQYPAAPWI